MNKLRNLLLANLISSIGTGVTSYLIIWMLIDQLKQSVLYGILTIIVMVLVFFISPYLGVLVDRSSRKKIFLMLEISGFLVLSLFLGLYGISYLLSMSLVIFLIIYTTVYDAIKFPTIYALTQEIFTDEEYNKVNSTLEVQGQSALVISSGLAALMVGTISFNLILIINILTYAIAAVLIYFLPYQRDTKVEKQINENKGQTKFNDFKESLYYMKGSKVISILLFTTLVPSIVIIVANYLDPVFVYDYLEGTPATIGVANISYAIGAILGGTVSFWVGKKQTDMNAILSFILIFSIGTLILFIYPSSVTFIAISLIWGLSNSSIRVFRKSFMFRNVNNYYMGRVNSLFSAIKLLVQAIFIGLLTVTVVPSGQTVYGYLILFFVLLLSFIVTIYFKKLVGYQNIPYEKSKIE